MHIINYEIHYEVRYGNNISYFNTLECAEQLFNNLVHEGKNDCVEIMLVTVNEKFKNTNSVTLKVAMNF